MSQISESLHCNIHLNNAFVMLLFVLFSLDEPPHCYPLQAVKNAYKWCAVIGRMQTTPFGEGHSRENFLEKKGNKKKSRKSWSVSGGGMPVARGA